MKRFLSYFVMSVSLILVAASAAMWVRSFRALDRLDGQAAGADFYIDSFAGQCEIRIRQNYRSRLGAESGPALLNAHRPFDLLQADPLKGGNYVARSRWPLADTDQWQSHASFFPRLSQKAWLGWARDGPGHFAWIRVIQIPYWLLMAAFAAVPALAVARQLLPNTRRRKGLCRHCGYDLRETPQRCPECGRVPDHSTAAAT
jgi:hypothetical protein